MKVTSFSNQTSSMTSINFGTLLTTIFVVVDDWCQKQLKKTTALKPGVKASMSDSALLVVFVSALKVFFTKSKTLVVIPNAYSTRLSMVFVFTLLPKLPLTHYANCFAVVLVLMFSPSSQSHSL